MIEFDTLKYEKVEVSNDLLTSAEEAGYTYLHCTYTVNKEGGAWINIWKSSYLVNDGVELKLVDAVNIPYSPEKHILFNFGDTFNFTLIFPAVPKDWATFDFIERCENNITGFNIKNIVRNETGAYRVRVTF